MSGVSVTDPILIGGYIKGLDATVNMYLTSSFLLFFQAIFHSVIPFVTYSVLLMTVIIMGNDILMVTIIKAVAKSERGKLLGLFYSLRETFSFITYEIVTSIFDAEDLIAISIMGMLIHFLLLSYLVNFFSEIQE